jgi:hypothetical protein
MFSTFIASMPVLPGIGQFQPASMPSLPQPTSTTEEVYNYISFAHDARFLIRSHVRQKSGFLVLENFSRGIIVYNK